MPTDIIRHQTPEEVELNRKREELAAVRAELAEKELELADFRAQLKSFKGRYLREVGVLYAELDEYEARIAEREALLETNLVTKQRAAEARERATESHDATRGEAAQAEEFKPTLDLRSLFRDVAKRIHPDFAKDDADRQRRHELMARANDAYSRGDSETLRRILDEYSESSESVQGEGIGAELIRIIRQIHTAKKDIAAIAKQIANLRTSETGQLMQEAATANEKGRDLLVELATQLTERVRMAREKYEHLNKGVE